MKATELTQAKSAHEKVYIVHFRHKINRNLKQQQQHQQQQK